MIIKRKWTKVNMCSVDDYIYEGWFLFGFIPLYIRQLR